MAIVINGLSTPFCLSKQGKRVVLREYKLEDIQRGMGPINVLSSDIVNRQLDIFRSGHTIVLKRDAERINDIESLKRFSIIDFDVDDEEGISFGKRNPELYKGVMPYIVICVALAERGYTPVLRTRNKMIADLARMQLCKIVVDLLQ